MSDPVPKFSRTEPRYPQDTFAGRYKGILEVIDPRTLFITSAQLERQKQLLADFDNKQLSKNVNDTDLWYARKVVESSVHPVTGETLLQPFRMSAFVPMNVPVCLGMLTTSSLAGTVFWQWVNQSYNSATNYANRSGADMSTQQIVSSYAIATGTACSIGFGLRYLVNNGPKVFGRLAGIPGVIPYCAVGAAGSANVWFTRAPEMETGVQIVDEYGEVLGMSQTAAYIGIKKTIISRSLGLPLPVILFPGFVLNFCDKIGFTTGRPRVKMATELCAITFGMSLALPACLAMFPQRLPLAVSELEVEFHGLKNKRGEKVTTVYANKGL